MAVAALNNSENSMENLPPIKILGISGSPRQEGTAFSVLQALAAAETVAGVETEYLSLAGKNIQRCDRCDYCQRHYEQTGFDGYTCEKQDDLPAMIATFLAADGYIIGTPVYESNVSGLLKSFFDRCRPLTFSPKPLLNFRVGGALAVGGGRNGGQEKAMLAIRSFYLLHQILVCGNGHDGKLGVALWSKDGGASCVRQDLDAIDGLQALGKNVAEAARLFKLGRDTVSRGP